MCYSSEEGSLYLNEAGKKVRTLISRQLHDNEVVLIKLERMKDKGNANFLVEDVSSNFQKIFPDIKVLKGSSIPQIFGKRNAKRLFVKIEKSIKINKKISFEMNLRDEQNSQEYIVNIMPELMIDEEKLKMIILIEEKKPFPNDNFGNKYLDFIHTYKTAILQMSHSKDFDQFIKLLESGNWLKKAWTFSCVEGKNGKMDTLNLVSSVNSSKGEAKKMGEIIKSSEEIQKDLFSRPLEETKNLCIRYYMINNKKMNACIFCSEQLLPVFVAYELSDKMVNNELMNYLTRDLLQFLFIQVDRLITQEKTKEHQMLLDMTLENMGISLWTIDVRSKKFKSHNYKDVDTKTLISEVVHPKDQKRAYKNFQALISGTKKRMEISIRLRREVDLEYRWITCKGILLEDNRKVLMHRICGVNIDIHEKVMSKSKREYDLKHDSMTGLYNRTYLEKIMDKSIAKYPYKQYIAFYIDINNFKKVNDLYGYKKGDEYLIEIAQIIKSTTPKGYFVGRFSGDEFFIFGERTTTIEKTYDLLNTIKETLLNQFYLLGISASIGVVRYPEDAKTSKDMIIFSDIAMYQAREKGNNIIHFFDSSYATEYLIDFIKLKEIRQGLKNKEFILHYQPVIDYENNQVISVEALVRWQHPEKGLIYPNDFIELAELSGDICILGEQVIDQAIEQLKKWENTNKQNIYISVNLSHRQMENPMFAKNTINKLILNGIKASSLCFEMTETAFVKSSKNFYDNFRLLKEFGCPVAMDDFGMEYSSLSKLQDIPFDVLKIDRHFTQTIEDNPISIAIIELIVKIIKVLNKKAIVEGVENEKQLEIIHQLGLNNIQGYYFSKPLPIEKVESFISKYLE